MDNITVVDLTTGGELNSQDINILEGSISTSLFNPSTDRIELTVTDTTVTFSLVIQSISFTQLSKILLSRMSKRSLH